MFRLPAVKQMTRSSRKALLIEHRTVDGLDIRLAYTRRRRKQQPWLLIYNGLGANLEILAPLMNSLTTVNCLTFDMPGIGGSSRKWLPMSLAGVVRLSAKILDDYPLHQAAIMGVSWGACAAREFAWRLPNRCTKLILASAPAGIPTVPASLNTLLELANPKRYLDKNYLRRHAGSLYGGHFRQEPELVEAYLSLLDRHRSPISYYYQALSSIGWSSLPGLTRITQPTLVMAGKDDRMLSSLNTLLLRKQIPQSKLAMVDDGHLFVYSSPKETAEIVTEFLQPPPSRKSTLRSQPVPDTADNAG